MHPAQLQPEREELQPLVHLAEQLKIDPADILRHGLDRLLHHAGEIAMQQETLLLHSLRQTQLPDWADRARELHAAESMT